MDTTLVKFYYSIKWERIFHDKDNPSLWSLLLGYNLILPILNDQLSLGNTMWLILYYDKKSISS